jgi:hypothetical protein
MITIEEKEKLVEQSFERFEAEGKEWVSADDDLALDYMLNHPDYQRRRRVADWFRGILHMPEGKEPKKASHKYSSQVQQAVLAMNDRREVEFRFLNENGELPETPPEGRLHSANRRYRRVIEAEASVEPVSEPA